MDFKIDAPMDLESIPGFLCLDHVAIAVPAERLKAQVQQYELLGFQVLHQESMGAPDHVDEVLLQIGSSPNLIQLLAPNHPQSPVHRQLERQTQKPGFAHIGVRVANIHHAFEYVQKQNFRVIDSQPRPGSRGTTVFFIHPKSHTQEPFDLLIEIVQEGTHHES